MVNYTKDLKLKILLINILVEERNVVFQKIAQIMMDYHINYILLHRVINIKHFFVIIFLKN
jgi:hypothetical protein